MNVKSLQDQGRSKLDQMLTDSRERVRNRQGAIEQQAPTSLKDVFERSKSSEENAADKDLQKSSEPAGVKADGLNISFQFDLFYELTSKVEAKMGQQGANRFVELSGKVSETFMGNFSLSIDPVGSFMNGTGKSLEISPETTSQFFDAVEGLADLSPEALENFLKESDKFFADLEKTYGEAGGAFDEIKSQMQDQAKAFFADVEKIKSDVLGTSQKQELPAAPATESGTLKPENADATDLSSLLSGTDKESSLIEMLFNPKMKVSQSDYKDFLSEFVDYATKFRQQMFEKLFSSRNPYEKAQKGDDGSEESVKKIINTAV